MIDRAADGLVVSEQAAAAERRAPVERYAQRPEPAHPQDEQVHQRGDDDRRRQPGEADDLESPAGLRHRRPRA